MTTSKNSLLRPGLWDVMTGIPAGMLIFMTTVLFSTLFSVRASLPVFVPLIILAGAALSVGLLAGITRLRRGAATGLVAGLVVAGFLGYLWFAASPTDEFNPLVIGPVGMLSAIIISPVGGWLGAKIRKAL